MSLICRLKKKFVEIGIEFISRRSKCLHILGGLL